MGASLTITKTKKGYCFEGSMDEFANLAFYSTHIHPEEFPNHQPMEFDFDKVTRSNSAGLVEWLKYVQGLSQPFFYIKCPPWMVGQFNSISQFFPEQLSAVVSFYVPYYCNDDDSNRNFLYVIGKEVKLDQIAQTDSGPKSADGKSYVPDFMPEKYFAFLERNKDNFKQFFSSYRLS